MPGCVGRLPAPHPGTPEPPARLRGRGRTLQTSARSAQPPSTNWQGPQHLCHRSQLSLLTGCEAIKAACSRHTGCAATSSDISDCWFVSDNKFTKRCSHTPGPQAHSDTRPGVRTHGQSRSKRRQPSLRGKAAEPGDPGPSPQGPLECAVHRAVTELGFLWDSQACALEFRTPQEHPRGPGYVRSLRRLGQEGTRS